jgi:lipoprotein
MQKQMLVLLFLLLFSCKNNSINNTEDQHIDTLDTDHKEIISEEESEITQLSPNPIKRTFVLTVVGERPYKKQLLFLTDSLVINEERYIQIVDNKVFRDLIDMDYYTYRIKELPIQNDSIISFTLDKEGSEFEENSLIKWFDFSSENSPRQVTIKKRKNSILWELYYDNDLQGSYIDFSKDIIEPPFLFIEDKDVKRSGYPILYDDEKGVYR